MSPRRLVLDTLGDGPPFQLAMLAIAVVRGLSYTTGFLPASLAEQALPKWALDTCLLGLALGALVTFVAVLTKNFDLERLGLPLLGTESTLYALVLLYQRPHAAFLNYFIYFMLAAACWGRWRRMRRLTEAVL